MHVVFKGITNANLITTLTPFFFKKKSTSQFVDATRV